MMVILSLTTIARRIAGNPRKTSSEIPISPHAFTARASKGRSQGDHAMDVRLPDSAQTLQPRGDAFRSFRPAPLLGLIISRGKTWY